MVKTTSISIQRGKFVADWTLHAGARGESSVLLTCS